MTEEAQVIQSRTDLERAFVDFRNEKRKFEIERENFFAGTHNLNERNKQNFFVEFEINFFLFLA